MKPRRSLAVLASIVVLLAGCSAAPDGSPPCGWDLRTEQGQQASKERLSLVVEWLRDHPGAAPPSPSSTYWHGDCPTPAQPPAPPEGEGDQPEG